ncbi:MAG: hypothetical protein PHE24_05010 [Patescibacteria group bacterium]|nr:hypothetical protein [Patescibacteria group bacterium]
MTNNEQLEKIIAETISRAGKKIEAPRPLLAEIIKKASVTENEVARYKDRGEEKGRASLIIKFFNIMNWKIAIPVTLVVVLAVFFAVAQGGHKAGDLAVKPEPAAVISEAAPATLLAQSADELTADILAGIDEENLTIADEDLDASLIDADSEAIDNYLQSYDASQI